MLDAPVSALIRRLVVRVDRATPLKDAIRLLRDAPSRSLAVMDGRRLVGLFGDRDMVEKCCTDAIDPMDPVEQVMEGMLVTVTPDTSIRDALRLMDMERLRFLPLVEADGTLRGLIRGRDLLEYIAESIPDAVLNQPPQVMKSLGAREGA